MRKLILGIVTLLVTNSLCAKNIYATFEIEATKSSNLAFSSSGIVKDVLVDITSVVKKDAVIARLKNDDLKALLESYKTVLKYAKLDYDRQLKVRKIIDKSKFDQYAFKYENAKAQLKYQQTLFDKTILKAPFDGVIFDKIVEVGDVVSGQAIRTILKIQSKNDRKLVLEFDQKYHNDVKVGDSFVYKLDGNNQEYKGIISKIYPLANNQNRKITAEVKTTNMMVGLFGDGTIITKK